MSSCLGCSCTRPDAVTPGGAVLIATRVSHTLTALRDLLAERGLPCADLAPGLVRVCTPDPAELLSAARRRLSSVEAAEVRAVVLAGEEGDALLALALAAPTLAQLGARARHADLVPLFADERTAFRSEYQPIVSLTDPAGFTVIGHEALLRATGPDGPLMPDAMFAAADEAGWLHVLDRVGRTTALRGAAGWLGEDLLFVNFLPTTIYRPQVCLGTTELAAEQAGLRLNQLVFEVTESERVTDLDHLADVFAYYRERGCRVALDDLGAGYSSLNMLVRLQPDIVKLDKEIVQRLPDPASAAVIAAVVGITHSYGGLVLAECVETADQAQASRDLGVDLGQGWYFGRPVRRAAAQTGQASPVAGSASQRAALDHRGNDAAVSLVTATPSPATAPAPAPGLSAAPAPAPPTTTVPDAGLAGLDTLMGRAVQACSTGVSICDARITGLPLVYVNAAFERLTGYAAAEVLGKEAGLLQGTDSDPEAVLGMRAAIRAGREHVVVVRNYCKDGRAWWNELRLSPVRDEADQVTHYFGFQNDVTARVEAEQRVAHLAYHDALTGLPNRTQLLERLDAALVTARADGGHLAVLFVDLDGFKVVNDQLGHAAGDLVLIAAAERLRATLRDDDLLGRYSGDEFLVVLTGVTPQQVEAIAERVAGSVVDSFRSPLSVSGDPVEVGASVGMALFPLHGTDGDTLLHAADGAMYAAKQAGRGRAAVARQRLHGS